MIKIEKVKTYGWEAAVRGMRNPFNSWAKSDSTFDSDGYPMLGPEDLKVMGRLIKAGPDHAKFTRMITITMDITAPRYWWAEFDTYKVGTVANSCSTMHKLMDHKFTLDDFSCEGLDPGSMELVKSVIKSMNYWRSRYLVTPETDKAERERCWLQVQKLKFETYNQKRTVMLNYEVARRMYHARKGHKLSEWNELRKVFEGLPYSGALITVWG